MPFRSQVSLDSETGSSTKPDSNEKHPRGSRDEDMDAKKLNLGTPTPLTPSVFTEAVLPPPVQSSLSSGRKGKSKKNARIGGGLRIRWDKLRRRIGTGTAPSTSSAIEESVAESSGFNRSRVACNVITTEDPDAPVDEVVVDREWSDEIKSSSVTHSEHGGSPEKSGGSNHLAGTNTDHDSLAMHADGWAPWVYLRWRLWPAIYAFFYTQFLDERSEQHYRKENWFLRKNLAVWSSAFYIANWAFAIGFIPRPVVLPDKIFYYGLAPALTFPIVPMVLWDWPRDRPTIYQIFLAISTWQWGLYNIIFIYTSALQTIAIFGLKLHRFPAMIGAVCFFALSCGLILPLRAFFIRNIINFVFFQGFLLYVHYMREHAERRMYTLRDQLKVQFRATQKAQVNERKAADSKRRLTSYVFHEVRVPLNTALLAVQNMEASGTVAKEQDIEFKALEGSLSMMSKVLNDVLDFNRMDSGRFESVLKPYSFHQVMRSLFVPLQLATDARGLEFVIDLDPNIDDVARIALYEALGMSKEAMQQRMAERPDEDGIVVGDETRLRQIITNLASNACKFTPTGGKLVVSTRLLLPHLPHRHESTNVAAELPKDCSDLLPSGAPASASPEHADCPDTTSSPRHQQLSINHLTQHNFNHSKPSPLEWIVVRIEVTDTGCGIRPRDMKESKLFSAFNQTEQGRQQGGKGTGLGLALVRQIVKLSGGRLGVQSKVNEGSTFWVELPLGVGVKAVPGFNLAGTSRSLDRELLTRSGSRSRRADVDSSRNNATTSPPNHSRGSSSSDTPQAQSPASRSSSALQSIMEQGGLVEMSTRRGDSSVPTRTIGDPSTGTDPTRAPAKEECSPSPSLAERRSAPSEQSTETIKPPKHLKLPKPQRFSLDDPIPDVSPSDSDATNTNNVISNAASNTSAHSPHPSLAFDPGLRVLVVDDDPLTRKLMSRMLTRLRCKVSTAENGEIALEMILGMGARPTPSSEDTGSGGFSLDTSEEYRFSIIFLDNQMPVLSGLEAVAKLRAMGRRDFVVGVTGNALLTDQQEYLEAGVDHVLTKPVYEKSLKGMLSIADDRRKRGTPASERPEPSMPSSPMSF
ncbi:unnamed protein product [Somion occarium]|uniref:histidine kinase n=1 Tax=Somion occarium TaxID=3059160 RepID=A0ABP1EC67_9APHY